MLPASREHGDTNMLLELDLWAESLARSDAPGGRRSFLAHTCIFPTPLIEDDYLSLPLPRAIASTYEVEMVQVNNIINSVLCLVADAETSRALQSVIGLSTPYCYQKAMERLQKQLIEKWLGENPSNFVVPRKGTVLFLMRGGHHPWMDDIDLEFHSTGSNGRGHALRYWQYMMGSQQQPRAWEMYDHGDGSFFVEVSWPTGDELFAQVQVGIIFVSNSSVEDFPYTASIAGNEFRINTADIKRVNDYYNGAIVPDFVHFDHCSNIQSCFDDPECDLIRS